MLLVTTVNPLLNKENYNLTRSIFSLSKEQTNAFIMLPILQGFHINLTFEYTYTGVDVYSMPAWNFPDVASREKTHSITKFT